MASSSRSFQSQTISRLLAGYRQMAHGAERLLRQGKTALLWGVQVIAFPLYVAFQGVRSAARTLQATQPWQQVVTLLTGEKNGRWCSLPILLFGRYSPSPSLWPRASRVVCAL